MMGWLRMKKKKEAKAETPFLKNGGMLLEKLIATCNGKCNPIRNFSIEELKGATNNFDSGLIVHRDCLFEFYRGSLQDVPISVKRFRDVPESWVSSNVDVIFKDIVVSSLMSAHKNAVKLLGCCLETQFPILVHDLAWNGTLEDRIRGSHGTNWQPLPWDCVLRIAMDIANAVAYLHNAFSRPIIHRNIQPHSILLDQQDVAKLYDFSLCISIPEGKSHVEDSQRGTWGFLAPEYLTTGLLTEKVDVYAFGMLLLVLLSGRRAYDRGSSLNCCLYVNDFVKYCLKHNFFNEALDPAIAEVMCFPGKEKQLLEFTEIAFRCIAEREEQRPTMIDVAKQLRQISQPSTPEQEAYEATMSRRIMEDSDPRLKEVNTSSPFASMTLPMTFDKEAWLVASGRSNKGMNVRMWDFCDTSSSM